MFQEEMENIINDERAGLPGKLFSRCKRACSKIFAPIVDDRSIRDRFPNHKRKALIAFMSFMSLAYLNWRTPAVAMQAMDLSPAQSQVETYQ